MRYLRGIASVLCGFIKTVILKTTSPRCVFIGKRMRCYFGVEIRVRKNSKLSIGNCVSVGKRTLISSLNGGKIEIGDNAGINSDCKIVSHYSIKIGKNTIFAPGVMVYDHDHIFSSQAGVEQRKFKTAPIEIGENCWIGANAIILRGTKIGNNCVIGAGSVVKGEIADGTLFVQKRENEYISIREKE